jgi:hypothetical protein
MKMVSVPPKLSTTEERRKQYCFLSQITRPKVTNPKTALKSSLGEDARLRGKIMLFCDTQHHASNDHTRGKLASNKDKSERLVA